MYQYDNRGLFSTYYLHHQLPKNSYLWIQQEAPIAASFAYCKKCFQAIKNQYIRVGDRTDLETNLIRPLLKQLGFEWIVLSNTERSAPKTQPDYLLVDSNRIRNQNAAAPIDHYNHACAILEVKQWGRRLNDRDLRYSYDSQDPTAQLVRLLNDAHARSNQNIEWGILTNGTKWRLFYYGTQSKCQHFYEIDLERMIIEGDLESYKYFYLFFCKQAVTRDPVLGKSWLEKHLESSRDYAATIQAYLKQRIFDGVMEELAGGFLWYRKKVCKIQQETDKTVEEIYNGCLILLYRLLFLLFVESRAVIPLNRTAYQQFSLMKLSLDMRRERDRIGEQGLSFESYKYWSQFNNLCKIIKNGDSTRHVFRYLGELFNEQAHPFLAQNKLPDPQFAMVIQILTEFSISDKGEVERIDYSSLNVRQLGDIYEGLLELQLRIAREPMVCIKEKGKWVWIPTSMQGDQKAQKQRNKGELYLEYSNRKRKQTGTYFTPDSIVNHIVHYTVGTVIENRFKKTEQLMKIYERETTSQHHTRDRIQKLERELFETLFSISILDPAMGSGNFLVHAADYLSDRIIMFLSKYPNNPVLNQMDRTRSEIKHNTQKQGRSIDTSPLTDINLIKQMVLKRCIYGVDRNPMAVELAKLSLWLDCFPWGAPLSFLGHHLKCGNSLIGADIKTVCSWFASSGADSPFQGLKSALTQYNQWVARTNSITEQVDNPQKWFARAEQVLAPYNLLLDVYLSKYFIKRNELVDFKSGWSVCDSGEAFIQKVGRLDKNENECVEQIKQIRQELRFFHWELEFPERFFENDNEHPTPGFDCIIGNPPWKRVKLQENEFFAKRNIEIALASTASKRKALIKRLPTWNPTLWDEYIQAKNKADSISHFIRASNRFPLLGQGDLNYYTLMTEQATHLVSQVGRVGFVIPSGIATDQTSGTFFQKLVIDNRLVQLIDFENKKGSFQHIHKSFKYSIVILGGHRAAIQNLLTAFYLHDLSELADSEKQIQLSNKDFSLINPNTKNVAMFRNYIDFQITKSIYETIPILITRQTNRIKSNPWEIRLKSMFHMTNDSSFFSTSTELEAIGYTRNEYNQYIKEQECYLPLYEGKMIQLWDYRAATIRVDSTNLHRSASSVPTDLTAHANPRFMPVPRFWVDKQIVINRLSELENSWVIGYKQVCAPSNRRTFITSALPYCAMGNSLPIIVPRTFPNKMYLLLANLSSFVLDYIVRTKVGGQNLNFFIVEQLPVLPPQFYLSKFKGMDLSDFIKPRVLELVYTAYSIQAVAKDLDYLGEPYPWDPERRLHLQCQLDALFFLLYKIEIKQVGYILESFPIVKKQDRAIYGWYRTRTLIEGYYQAYQIGDWDAWVHE